MEKKIIVTGLGYLWEGKSSTQNGESALIIAGPRGEKLVPLRISTQETPGLASGQALINISPGVHLVRAKMESKGRGLLPEKTIEVHVVLQKLYLQKDGHDVVKAVVKLIYKFDDGKWNKPLPRHLLKAVEAAERKLEAKKQRVFYALPLS